MMREVERLLETKGDAEDARQQMISSIAAWALDHPGEKVEPAVVFPQLLRRMREAIFAEQAARRSRCLARDVVRLVRDEGVRARRRTRKERAEVRRRSTASSATARTARPMRRACSLRRRFHDLVV